MERQNDQGGIRLQLCKMGDCPRSMTAWCTPLYSATMCSITEQEISKVTLIPIDSKQGSIYKEIPWEPK